MEKDIVKERLDIIQEVIDRLIYLPKEEVERYKKDLEKLQTKYHINAVDKAGLRIINPKNYGTEASV